MYQLVNLRYGTQVKIRLHFSWSNYFLYACFIFRNIFLLYRHYNLSVVPMQKLYHYSYFTVLTWSFLYKLSMLPILLKERANERKVLIFSKANRNYIQHLNHIVHQHRTVIIKITCSEACFINYLMVSFFLTIAGKRIKKFQI